MVALKSLLFSILGINSLILVICFLFGTDPKRELPGLDAISDSYESEYSFVNPELAYKVLSQFDVYNLDWPGYVKPRIPTATLGLTMDDDYCDKHRAFFVENPQHVFETMNILSSWATGTFVSDTFSSVANDLHAHIMKTTTKKQRENYTYPIYPETNSFFTSKPIGVYFNITKHASCLFQASNQIPGQIKLGLKDNVAAAANEYVKKFEDRTHCVNYDKYFPETWNLKDKEECQEFFERLLSPEYQELKKQRKIVYMKKIPDSHRGEGVQPLTSIEERKIKKEYENGTLCGEVKKSLLMQHYIHNSLLLHGHKFDFRMYLLIASTNPLIAYYHDGFLRVTLAEYDASSDDKKVLLTNLALNKQIYDDVSKGNLYDGKDMEDLKQAQQWNFDRLQAYLLAAGVIKDPNWLDNYLRPEFKKAMIHLVRLSSDNFARHSSFYGLYGVDFMLDTNLNLWFIEANAGPALDGYSEPMGKFISKMLIDHLEIVYGLLRSRIKRAINFVNNLINEEAAYEKAEGGLVVKNFERHRKVFESITMNYFDKEFEVSEDNGFAKIIDENEQGEAVYQGLIEPDCVDF